VLEKEGIQTELYQFSGKSIHGCKACMACFKNKDMRCAFNDDDFNEVFEKNGFSRWPYTGFTHLFYRCKSEMKGLIDRAGFVSFANGRCFRRKTGAAVVAVRRAGSTHVLVP
jgi:multimeric flavodoxin WrbA